MSLFRRGKTSSPPDDAAVAGADAAPAEDDAGTAPQNGPGAGRDDLDADGAADVDGLEEEHAEDARRAALETRRAQEGPFDASEVGADVAPVDLGALRLGTPEGMELRLEVEQGSQRVVAVTLATKESTVQVHLFAAPRTAGVWDEVRAEIAASVTEQGGVSQEIENDGGFGRELLAQLPARTADGAEGVMVTRFTGVDGPRWFLRAVFSGAAALRREAAAPFEAAVRGAVVVRGDEAMAPRDLLSLTFPAGTAPSPEAMARAMRPAGPGESAGAGR